MRASRNNGAGGSLHPSQHGVPIGDGRRSLRAVKWLASCPPSPRSMIDPGASKLRREASCAGPGGGVFGSFGVGMVPAEPSSLHQHPGASSQNDLASSTCVWLVALGRSGDRRLDDRALRLWSTGWRSADDCGTRSSADRVVHDLGVETRGQHLCDGNTRRNKLARSSLQSFAPYSGALFISISSISRICTTSAAIKRCAYSSSAIDLSLTMSIKSR